MNNRVIAARRPLRRTVMAMLIAGACIDSARADDAQQTAQHSATLPQVVVTGTAIDDAYAPEQASVGGKSPLRLIDIPQSVTVFTSQRMQDQNLNTLGDLLQQAPGITVLPFDGANPDYRSRGYSLDLAYDGIPANNAGSGSQEFGLAIYERVEILRGPSGITQGSAQPGGVINFVRKRGTRTLQSSFAASTGSWDNHRVEADVGGPLNAAGTLRARAVATFQDRDYFYDTGHDRKWMAYVALDADLDRDTVLSFSYARQIDDLHSPSSGLPAYLDGGFIDLPRSVHVYPAWGRFAWATSEASAELGRKLAAGWEARVRTVHRNVDKFFRDSYPSTGVDRATMTATYARRMNDSDFERNGADVYATGPFSLLGRRHTLTLGYNYDERRSTGRSVTYATVPRVSILNPGAVPEPVGAFDRGTDSRVAQSGYYVQSRLSVADPLTLTVGARATNYRSLSRNVAPSPVTPWLTGARERGEVAPSAAALWHIAPELNAYVSYADIFLPQTQLDASRRVLDPRVGSQVEVGAKGRFLDSRLTASAAVFSTRDRNRALVTNVPDVFASAGEVKVRGAELELGGTPVAALDVTAGYTYLSTKYGPHPTLEGAQFSTFEPKHTFKLYTRYRPAALPRAFVGGGLTASSAALGGGVAGVREGSGYAVANAQLGYRFDGNVTLSLSVANLFDRTYHARVGGINSYNIYGDPRTATLTLRGSFL